jgi:hypothetical protein
VVYNFCIWRFQTSVQKFRVSTSQTALHQNEIRLARWSRAPALSQRRACRMRACCRAPRPHPDVRGMLSTGPTDVVAIPETTSHPPFLPRALIHSGICVDTDAVARRGVHRTQHHPPSLAPQAEALSSKAAPLSPINEPQA